MADPRYRRRHQEARERALKTFVDGSPCVRCFEPLYRHQGIDLDHSDADPNRYNGLAHSVCNRREGGRIGGLTTAARYFGKTPGPRALDVPPPRMVACACGQPHCTGQRSQWNSRCW